MFKVHFCQSLRSLREMERIRVLFLHADYAKSAENFLFHGSRWRWRGRELRYDKMRRADANGYRLEVSGFYFHLSVFRLSRLCVLLSRVTATS